MKGCMKMKFMQIPNAKTRALEIENGSSSSIPMLVIETICFTQKKSQSQNYSKMDHLRHHSQKWVIIRDPQTEFRFQPTELNSSL